MGYRLTPREAVDNTRTTAISYDTNDNLEYQGSAPPGSSKSVAKWQIRKFTYDVNGNLTDIQFAYGNRQDIYVWDDRASYPYS